MADRTARLTRGLAWIAAGLCLASGIVAAIACFAAPRMPDVPGAVRAALAGIGLALAAMLVGMIPLWRLLLGGPENIVTAWLAAMLVRMLACVVGLVVLINVYAMPAVMTALTVAGHYVVLLAVETTAMTRLMNRLDRKA